MLKSLTMEESKSTSGNNRKIIIVITFLLIFLTLIIATIALFKVYKDPQTAKIVLTPTPTPTKMNLKTELTGWLASWDDTDAPTALPETINYFETFSPMLYKIMPGGELGRHQISNRTFILNQARENNIPIIPVITDESDTASVNRILSSNTIQNNFIDELIDEAKAEDFAGWAIDIEILKSGDEQKFSSFIKNAATQFHENDLKLNVIVFGRVEKESYDPARAHNYKTIGRYADQIQLMTYNFNNDYTDPGGQTPLNWYRDVLKYAVTNVPPEKILVGLSTHGYDWTGDEVVGLNFDDAIELIEENNSEVKYDSKNSSNYSNFTDDSGEKHSVWFEDAKSIKEKVDIAKNEFGINKFALWRLTAEDPKVWESLKN